MGAGRRLERDRVHAADLGEDRLELVEQLERALGDRVGGHRVEPGEPGSRAAHSSILGLYFIVHEPSG